MYMYEIHFRGGYGPGDELIFSCTYDTSSRTSPTTFGDFTQCLGEGPRVYRCRGFDMGWVKTLVPSEPQNSWDLWMFIPLKMVLIGIDP